MSYSKRSRRGTLGGARGFRHVRRTFGEIPKSLKIKIGTNSSILQKAFRHYQQNKFREVIETLGAIHDYHLLEPLSDRILFLQLRSLSLPHLERFMEAEEAAREGLELSRSEYDFHFVLAYVAMMLKDYGGVIGNGIKYTELLSGESGADNSGHLTSQSAHLLHNYLGIAYRQTNECPKAQESFERAIELAPWYDHPYVNLANYFIQKREFIKGDEIIEKGLKNCSQVQELRILKKNAEHRTTVSACLIVKDEEEHLPTCLESIRNWVDEIIVVDTGSKDRTVEIANSYGAKVYFQAWQGDFSKARNFSISQATMDWIFIIDADEEFVQDDVLLIKRVMAQEKYRLVSINVYNMNKETGEYTSFLPSFRLYRRDAGFYYDGIVHNQLKYDRREPSLRVGVSLKHYGYSLSPEKMKSKLARSRNLLEKQLETTPDDPYVHFNYAQLLRSTGTDLDPETCELIIKHARLAIQLTSDKLEPYLHVHLMAHHQLVTTFIYQKKFEEAEELCFKALALKADYLDPILSLGHIYSNLRKLDKAEEYFKKYLDAQAAYDESEETTNLILLYIRARHIAYYGLGLIEQFRGQAEKSEEYYKSVLSEFGPYLDTYLRLARIYLDRGDLERAKDILEQELQWHPNSDLGHIYMAECLGLSGKVEEAEESLRKSLQVTKANPEVYERSGCFYANSREFDKAIPLFEELIRIKPNYAYGHKLLAKANYDLGKFEKSLASYSRCLAITPEDAESLINMANCHFKLNDFEEAESVYHKVLDSDTNLAAVYRNLGLTKLRLGKVTEAMPLLEKYTEISPEDYSVQLAIGTIYCNMGSYGEAIPFVERYLSGNPSDVEGLFRISECYYHLGHFQSALIGYNQILKIDPNHISSKNRIDELSLAGTPT